MINKQYPKQFIGAPLNLKLALTIIEKLNKNFDSMYFDDGNHIIFTEWNGQTCTANADTLYEIASTSNSEFELESRLNNYINFDCNWF